MSASLPSRLGCAPDTRFESHSQTDEPVKRKRVISQEHIDALIIKAKAAWAEDAEKRALLQSTSSSVRDPYFPQLKRLRGADGDSEAPAEPRETTPKYHLPQKDTETSLTLSSKTLAYYQSLIQKMEETIKKK